MAVRPEVRSVYHAPTSTFSHLLYDPATRQAAVVDPVLDYDAAAGHTGTDAVRRMLHVMEGESLSLAWILETHAHADHLSAGAWLKMRTGAPIGIGEGIRQVQRTFREIYNLGEDFPVDGCQFDRLFADGERIGLGELEIEVMATPGHTSDSVSYRCEDAVFIGDTLFAPDYGSARCDFPGGDAALLWRSVQRLYALPGATRLLLCHDYPPADRQPRAEWSVAEQREGNVHLRGDTPEAEFIALRTERDSKLGKPALIIPSVQVNIRAGRLPEPEANGVRYLRVPLDVL
jgi:glyoxylase-like metal-dependent hydrolase (beta-lactamase superfamily II)